MNIIGVTGQIGHGKSTFASLIGECAFSYQQFESGQLVMEVANAWQKQTKAVPAATQAGLNEWIGLLPPILYDILHVDTDAALLEFTLADQAQDASMFDKLYQYAELLKVQPHLLQNEINANVKETYRPLLQWLGGYLVKMVSPGVWYDELIRRIKQAERDGADLAVITGLRFPGDAERVLEARGVVVRIIRAEGEDRDETDPTERERLTIPYQVTVYNDGSMADLAQAACNLHHDLTTGQLQVTYHAAGTAVV